MEVFIKEFTEALLNRFLGKIDKSQSSMIHCIPHFNGATGKYYDINNLLEKRLAYSISALLC